MEPKHSHGKKTEAVVTKPGKGEGTKNGTSNCDADNEDED